MKNLLLSLIILLSLCTTALIAQDADANKTVLSLKTKLTDANLTVDSEALAQNTEFVELVLGSESMDKAEKQYWLTALPTLVDKQIERMVGILRTEKQKLADLDAQYARESAQMTLRHAKERIVKIHELLQKPKKYKLTEDELMIGVEAAEYYLQFADTKEKPVLAKIPSIINTTLALGNQSDDNSYILHSLAYEAYAAKELYAKAINSPEKAEVLKDLAGDIKEFEKYKLPKNKIKIIRAIVSDKN